MNGKVNDTDSYREMAAAINMIWQTYGFELKIYSWYISTRKDRGIKWLTEYNSITYAFIYVCRTSGYFYFKNLNSDHL